MRRLFHYALQPLLLIVALAGWLLTESPLFLLALVVGVQLILGVLEYWFPARPDWLLTAGEKSRLVAVVAALYGIGVVVTVFYAEFLRGPLQALRASLGLDVWPTEWPMVLQVLLAFFLSELIWYWLHRAEHRWGAVWRVSGHGLHHAFKNLSAINFGANHPFEMLVIALPSLLVELLFGAGIATLGAAALLAVQVSIVHANLDLNSKWIGLLFTTNRYHIHHHSMVMAESNTNYGCAAIVWDRLFGTFADAPTRETGTGPTEPSLWAKLAMPFRTPADTDVAP